MRAVAALHADATALSSEWPGGPARAAAARNLMTALAAEIAETRAFAARPDERRSSVAWADFEAARRPATVRHNPIYRSPDATPGTQGLPDVDAVYTWVRLAQRVPVRVGITDVPPPASRSWPA